MNIHLAILKKQYIELILTGQKLIELRLTKSPCPPYNKIQLNDKIFLKISSGPVCALANVKKVTQLENLTPAQIRQLKNLYNKDIKAQDDYWSDKINSKFAVLIWLNQIQPISDTRITKKDYRAWAILTAQNNFDLFEKLDKKLYNSLSPRYNPNRGHSNENL